MRDCRVVDWDVDPSAANRYMLRALSQVRYIVIHHSGVDADSSSEQIAAYHVGSLGWPGPGYAYVVRQNGDIEYCGDLSSVRYNVAARNEECVGVCLVGDFSTHHPTVEQLGAAQNLCRVLMPLLDPGGTGQVKVVGHKEIALRGYATSCPGATWPEWLNAFAEWR